MSFLGFASRNSPASANFARGAFGLKILQTSNFVDSRM
jgi:hypothetical protein